MLGVDVGPHSTVSYGSAVRVGEMYDMLSMESNASVQGFSLALILLAM